MALKGIRVLEFAGLAPVPFCGMILSDFGATVIRIDRANSLDGDRLSRGKRSICLDLTKSKGVDVVKRLSERSDVLIDPFRPGVLEKLGLGPRDLNAGLIYSRISGYGQTGPMSKRAGHDINYMAISGLLSALGTSDTKPFPPINLLADFAGGGLLCAFAICMALIEKAKTGQGQVIDNSMTEGAAYIGSFIWRTQFGQQTIPIPLWGNPRGKNVLDGGYACYQTYLTKDGKYMAVGALEPKFYSKLLKGLKLDEDEYGQFEDQDKLKSKFAKVFVSKTQTEWNEIFENTDSCVTPVLSLKEAVDYFHNVERQAFVRGQDLFPKPAPRMSGSFSVLNTREPLIGEHSVDILKDAGYSESDISSLLKEDIVTLVTNSKL